MNRLSFYVCENFASEYMYALEKEGIEDACIIAYPCLCEKKLKAEAKKILFDSADLNSRILLCSKNCEALSIIADRKDYRIITGNYCFSYFTCDEFLDHLIIQGSYIITPEWLKNWKTHLSNMGFDGNISKQFFNEIYQKIVLLNSGILQDTEKFLLEFSSYVGLPYLMVPTNLEGIRLLLKSIVSEWKLRNKNAECVSTINELRTQCAEYSAVFDLMGKISAYSSKRDVIEKIKELFMMMFGVQHFKFWGIDFNQKTDEIQNIISNKENLYHLYKEQNRFIIKIEWNKTVYGLLDIGEFLFPQYIEKYLNLAIELSKYCGLVLHNNEQYEKIKESEQQMKYMSYHDSLTGLYNRTYINQILANGLVHQTVVVFMFDIDKLKYVNDNFGHAEGDKLIYNFAQIIKNSFRDSDIIARIGGDEFVAIMYNTDIELAEKLKRRIIKKIDIYNNNLQSLHLKMSVSIGFAIHQDTDGTLETTMKRADEIMYAEKTSKNFKRIP